MPPALITFPTSSSDELTDQLENSNQRISGRCYCSQNDDQHINHPFLQTDWRKSPLLTHTLPVTTAFSYC